MGGDLGWGPMATEPLEAAEQFRLTTTRCTYSSSISEFFFRSQPVGPVVALALRHLM